MKFLKTQKVSMVVAGALGFVVGVGITFLFDDHLHNSPLEERAAGDYQYVSPLLSCGEVQLNHLGGDEMLKLEKDLGAYIDEQKGAGKAAVVGVYFRQLKGGPWLGLNFEQEFIPGSLLKVPLAMALYRAADTRPGLFDEQIFFEAGDATENQYFKDAHVVPGQTYSIGELIESMLVYSDNNAANLLAKALSEKELFDTYRSLGIDEPEMGSDYTTTVRSYASFFRVLYNGTYLSAEDSEKLLTTLTNARFDKGLIAGIPWGVKVAHKFGERAVEGTDLVQLHDCGIVYHLERPYLLCVMTQGRDFDELTSVIASVSKLVYEHVN
jgi:hypothetical protein